MEIFCVLATGPSLTTEQVECAKKARVIAVSDAWRLCPTAEALCSSDGAWWLANPEAMEWPGRKFGLIPSFRPVPGVESFSAPQGTNSGLLGLMVAVSLGANRVLLCGFDMNRPGDHFFGRHVAPLKSTTAARQEVFKRQFANYRPRGVEIINCTPGSALHVYPKRDLEDCLAQFAVLAD